MAPLYDWPGFGVNLESPERIRGNRVPGLSCFALNIPRPILAGQDHCCSLVTSPSDRSLPYFEKPMWDEFESSARLLPSPQEKKEPEAAAKDDKSAAPAWDQVAPANPPVARIEEKTVAAPEVKTPEIKTEEITVAPDQNQEPVPPEWRHDSPQATFAFNSDDQATFAFYGNTEEQAADEVKQETISAAEDEPKIAAIAEDSQVEQAAAHREETVETSLAVAEEKSDITVSTAAPLAEEKSETTVSTASPATEEEPLTAVLTPAPAVEGKSPTVVSVADESVENAAVVHHEKTQIEHSPEVPDSKDPKASGFQAGKKKAFSLREEKQERPFRVKLRGSILVLVRLPNKRSLRGAFHQLSTSGGVIHLEKPLDEKVEVELIFHIQDKTIRNKAQMLFPMWATQGWMQPFRFIDLADKSKEVLDASLKTFLGDTSKGASAGA